MRIVALPGALLFLVVAHGCASTHPSADPADEVYRSDQVREFEAATAPDPHYQAPIVSDYVVGVGDHMDVVFPFHSNLTTRELLVRTDGKISLPYIGDHIAAGLTPMALDTLLSDKFSDILRDPNLSVIITKSAPQHCYVLGQVNNPGAVEFETEMSLLGAISSVGGFKSGAAARHAVLIRRQGVATIAGIEMDLTAIMTGQSIENDILLRNFDIVYVPQTRLSSTAEFAEKLNTIFGTPVDFTFKIFATLNASAQYRFFRKDEG